jgi:glycosyltransferase involved in cell wall biosynthesis
MLISVIIPTYNEEKVIGECLASLRSQTQRDFEVIVVDDGSTDNTKEIVKTFGVKLFGQKHQGPAMARNLGVMHAKGKIIVFVDSDMTFHSKFLRNLIEPIKQNKTKGTFSKDEFVSNWDNVWAKCWNINENLPNERRLPVDYPDTQKVFRAILKSEFDRVGGFSKGGYTDDYTLFEKTGYEATLAENAIFYHRNPETLREVYYQAKWVAKRKYKLGFFGNYLALFRTTFIPTLVFGIYKSIVYKEPRFLIFKAVYDQGIFVGVSEMMRTGKMTK